MAKVGELDMTIYTRDADYLYGLADQIEDEATDRVGGHNRAETMRRVAGRLQLQTRRDRRIREALDEINEQVERATELLQRAERSKEVDVAHAICYVNIPSIIARLTIDVGPWPNG